MVPAMRRTRGIAFVMLGVLGVVVASLLARNALSRRSAAPGADQPAVIRSLAVLPLDNYSGDPSQDYFAEGMTDELTTDLATISQLRVISRGSVMQFKGASGRRRPKSQGCLDVDAIVEGSVPGRGHGADHGPADRRAGGQAPVGPDLRAQLARRAGAAGRTRVAIAGEINVQLTPSEKSRLATSPQRESRGLRRLSQGAVFLQPPERREPEESDRAVRRSRQVESELRSRILRTLRRLPLGRLQRGVPDCQRSETQGQGTAERRSSWTATPPSPHFPRGVQAFYEYDLAVASANSAGRSRSTPTTPLRTISSG